MKLRKLQNQEQEKALEVMSLGEHVSSGFTGAGGMGPSGVTVKKYRVS